MISQVQQIKYRVQQQSIYSTVGKPIAMDVFTKVLVSMCTSVFTYYNVTIKQSANEVVNHN